MEPKPKVEEPKIEPTTELEEKIFNAFKVFDHSGKQEVDVREIGTILRSLGCCPSEDEIARLIRVLENTEEPGHIKLIGFLPYMVDMITRHRYYPADADTLLAAFRFFDSENHGYLTREMFEHIMLEEGEPFFREEVEEMLAAAFDPISNTIPYEYYVNQLLCRPEKSKEIYRIADRLEKQRLKEEAKNVKKRTSDILRSAATADAPIPPPL